jgi:hypothetical protein
MEMRRYVTPYPYRSLTIPTSQLTYIANCCMIQSPKSVLVKGLNALLKANFNTIGQEIILPEEILFLNFGV